MPTQLNLIILFFKMRSIFCSPDRFDMCFCVRVPCLTRLGGVRCGGELC